MLEADKTIFEIKELFRKLSAGFCMYHYCFPQLESNFLQKRKFSNYGLQIDNIISHKF